METKKHIVAANVTYSNITEDTKLLMEFKHTGVYYFTNDKKGKHQLSGIESAKENKNKGKRVYISSGHYFIDRLAIPSLPLKGGKLDWWYITNGDYYSVNKVSKYAKKLYSEMIKETINQF